MNTQWHELRAAHVGGSDVAALFGESPYMTKLKLWQIKKGNMQPANLDDVERVQAGNFLEGGIMAWANWKWESQFVQPKAYFKHPSVKGMGCTPDGIWVREGDMSQGDRVLCQIKNVDSIMFNKKAGWEADGDNITDAPLHILLQCHHEMAVTGVGVLWLIVCVGGNRLHRMVIERDDMIIRSLEREVAKFWESIEANDPPSPDYQEDGEVIKYMRSQLDLIDGQVDLSGNNALHAAIEDYKAAADQEKESKEDKTTFSNKILDLAGNTKKFICGGYKCTIVETSGTPDSIITQDMVGQVIKGRSGSVYPKITELK